MAALINQTDIAGMYQADENYEPGTVLEFGGEFEVTIGTKESRRVAGIVSTNPYQIINGTAKGHNMLPIALTGRVPCKVIGPVAKGDLLVSAGFGYARSHPNPAAGQLLAKAIQSTEDVKAVIEVAVA